MTPKEQASSIEAKVEPIGASSVGMLIEKLMALNPHQTPNSAKAVARAAAALISQQAADIARLERERDEALAGRKRANNRADEMFTRAREAELARDEHMRQTAFEVQKLTASARKVAELSAALSEIAQQKTTLEFRAEFGEDYETDWEGGYDGCIRAARALKEAQEPHEESFDEFIGKRFELDDDPTDDFFGRPLREKEPRS